MLYHPEIYRDASPVPSYWEDSAPPPSADDVALAGEQSCDVAVIGAGYTGISAALHLARDYAVDVRVLEAGHIGWGASGRNGGFCDLAATKLSIAQLVERYGLEETRRFYRAQIEGVHLVRSLADSEQIDFEPRGEGGFVVAHHPSRFVDLQREAEQLRRVCDIRARLYPREEFAEIGHDSTEQYGALHTDLGFALHPLKLLRGLAEAANRRGAVLHPHSRVIEWSRHGGRHRLRTDGGCLCARRVIVATNGFTRDDLHERLRGVVLPALSNIFTTRPLSTEELERHRWRTESPLCNSRALLFYYRLLPDRRILFGARGDTTGRPESAQRMRAWMARRFVELFPGWRDVPITHFWRGLVAVTRRLTPCVGALDDDPSVWFGLGYHANGVNTAPWVGRALAQALAGAGDAAGIPKVMSGLSPRFPLPSLRLWGLRAAYLYYRLRDDWI